MKHYLIKEYRDGKKMSVVVFEEYKNESFDGTHHIVNISYFNRVGKNHTSTYLDEARKIYKNCVSDGYKKTNETEDIISYISEQEEIEGQEQSQRFWEIK